MKMYAWLTRVEGIRPYFALAESFEEAKELLIGMREREYERRKGTPSEISRSELALVHEQEQLDCPCLYCVVEAGAGGTLIGSTAPLVTKDELIGFGGEYAGPDPAAVI